MSCSCNKCSHKKIGLRKYVFLSAIFILLFLFALRPFIVNLILYRASSFLSAGMHSKAESFYKRALVIDSKQFEVWDRLFYLYSSLNNKEAAFSALKNSISINPENKQARLNMGMLCLRDGRHAEAVEHFEYIRSLGEHAEGQNIVGAVSYYRSALTGLEKCYKELNMPGKEQRINKEIKRRYP